MTQPPPDHSPFEPLGDENEHFWLVQRMAKATGTDLVAAMDDGALTNEDWSAMVQHCRGCAWADGCHHWLDQPGTDRPRGVPQTCVNHERFARLRADYRTAAK